MADLIIWVMFHVVIGSKQTHENPRQILFRMSSSHPASFGIKIPVPSGLVWDQPTSEMRKAGALLRDNSIKIILLKNKNTLHQFINRMGGVLIILMLIFMT